MLIFAPDNKVKRITVFSFQFQKKLSFYERCMISSCFFLLFNLLLVFHTASMIGSLPIVQYLIEKGANIEVEDDSEQIPRNAS